MDTLDISGSQKEEGYEDEGQDQFRRKIQEWQEQVVLPEAQILNLTVSPI